MPPRLARLAVATSGPNCRSCARQGAVERVEDDAGLDAGRCGRRDRCRGCALRYLLQSRTTPGPIDWPDRLVPPPRGVIGTCISAAICTVATTSSAGLRHDDAERLDLVDAGVGAVEAARGGVEADLAGQVLAQVAGEAVAAEFGEVGHGGCIVPDRGGRGKARAIPRRTGRRQARRAEEVQDLWPGGWYTLDWLLGYGEARARQQVRRARRSKIPKPAQGVG